MPTPWQNCFSTRGKVWLVGQSLGGVVAQVVASRHPEVVGWSSNTCSLSGSMSKTG
ncbi:MAG: alpha/beta fold hydrolase [Flavonifractor plautii]